jgi:CheY-like chemotaxis protein
MIDESTILLADDNPDDALLMKLAFRKAGIINPIQVVKDGTEAVDYVKGEGIYANRKRYPFPDLLLLDLKMPRMSGFEVLSWIRQQPGLKRLVVIVLTHSSESPDIDRAHDLGANSYLVKPSNFNNFVEMVKSLRSYWLTLSEKPRVGANGKSKGNSK